MKGKQPATETYARRNLCAGALLVVFNEVTLR